MFTHTKKQISLFQPLLSIVMILQKTSNDFSSLTINLEKLVINVSSTNPHFILMIGDFNAKLSNWSSNDTTTIEGAQLDYLTSLYYMKQVITEPTHILENSSSCIDLIFSNQPNLINTTFKMSPSNNLLKA